MKSMKLIGVRHNKSYTVFRVVPIITLEFDFVKKKIHETVHEIKIWIYAKIINII